MRRIQWSLAFAMICGIGYASQALAGSILEDNGVGSMTVNYMFPSQTSSVCVGQDTCPYDTSLPNITTIVVEWNTSKELTKITVNSENGFLAWDSLFINNDYTGNASDIEKWDYLVFNGSGPDANKYVSPGETAPIADGLYKVTDNFTPDMYTHTVQVNGTGRAGHANSIDAHYLTGVGGVSIVRQGNSLVYDFSHLTVPISLGDNFAIGYTPWCANDAVLVAGTTGNFVVPEPATMVLFGVGTAALASWLLRRSAAKNQA